MVDGKDRDSQVGIDIRVRTNSAYLDFGFISDGSFTSLANNCCRKTNTLFAGGAVIDFAVRSQGMDSQFGTADDQIFRLSDSAQYADQYYSGRIKPWKSRNPEVLETYYSNLTLIWDLNNDGITDLKTALQARGNSDGFRAANPVPLPAAVWMFGSGLAVLATSLIRRRKYPHC
jgi:hypothetical protein